MGNTIVCPLSAESRGDRDSSGHRQRLGEGRPQVPAGDGGGRPGTRGRAESRTGGVQGRGEGARGSGAGSTTQRARDLRGHPAGVAEPEHSCPCQVLWLKCFLPSPCLRFPHTRNTPMEPAALKPWAGSSKKDSRVRPVFKLKHVELTWLVVPSSERK